jgi:hypothetical protein
MGRQAAHLVEYCVHDQILNQEVNAHKAKAGIGKNEAVSGGEPIGRLP